MPRLRLGVVLLLPQPVAGEVDVLRRACGEPDVERIAPHLTLVPPVNVRDNDVDAAVGVLRRAAAATRPFRLTLGPPTTFLPLTPVLYLEVGGDLDAAHALRDRVFTPPFERPLTWPFHPHVTLLDEAGEPRIRAAVAALTGYRTEVALDRVHILQEERRETDGARVWRPFAEARFTDREVVGRGGLELDLAETGRLSRDEERWAAEAWESHSRQAYAPGWAPDAPVAVTGRRDGRLVGVAQGRVRGDDGYLARLIVDPTIRGEGIGHHLLARFELAAARHGARRVTLRAPAGGPAEAFYRRRGYRSVAVLPRWRHGRDFVYLERAVPAP